MSNIYLLFYEKFSQALEGQMFNTFLEELKEQLRSKTSFWARIKEGMSQREGGI
jgi:hypothetical protein